MPSLTLVEDMLADQSVSIIMPMFNAARTVERAIASVVGQTHGNWQLICVDDGSTDGTVACVAAHAAKLCDRIVIARLDRNGGPARAPQSGPRAGCRDLGRGARCRRCLAPGPTSHAADGGGPKWG